MTRLCIINRSINKYKYYMCKFVIKLFVKRVIDSFGICIFIKKCLLFYLRLLNRNHNLCRYRYRCYISGRSRSVFSFFGLSRYSVKELFSSLMLPGFLYK